MKLVTYFRRVVSRFVSCCQGRTLQCTSECDSTSKAEVSMDVSRVNESWVGGIGRVSFISFSSFIPGAQISCILLIMEGRVIGLVGQDSRVSLCEIRWDEDEGNCRSVGRASVN